MARPPHMLLHGYLILSRQLAPGGAASPAENFSCFQPAQAGAGCAQLPTARYLSSARRDVVSAASVLLCLLYSCIFLVIGLAGSSRAPRGRPPSGDSMGPLGFLLTALLSLTIRCGNQLWAALGAPKFPGGPQIPRDLLSGFAQVCVANHTSPGTVCAGCTPLPPSTQQLRPLWSFKIRLPP